MGRFPQDGQGAVLQLQFFAGWLWVKGSLASKVCNGQNLNPIVNTTSAELWVRAKKCV